MSVQVLPTSGLSLHDAPAKSSRDQTTSTIARSAVLLRLNEQTVKELQQYSRDGKALRLLGGKIPRLQYGSKSTDLVVSSETCHHELYTSTGTSLDLSFRTLVTQRAEVKADAKPAGVTAGADEALANLKQSLASFAQDKEAKKATISSGVIGSSKNNKNLSAGRNFPASSQSSSRLGSPSGFNVVSSKLGPTSAPSDPQEIAMTKAMDRVLLHLLAMKPRSDDEIMAITHIPMSKCLERLNKIAEAPSAGQKWELKSKSYKDLDVWGFKYRYESDRQQAIDNAVRAFDRQRLSKDDKLWQMLLPEEERGKGKVLSRLHSGVVAQARKDRASSHLSVEETATDSVPLAKASTSTPRMGAMSVKKQFNMASKKREAEEAKEKKRQEKEKEKESAASVKEVKPRAQQPTQSKKPASKIKSAETVQNSDDDDVGQALEKDSVLGRSNVKGNSKANSSPDKAASARKAPIKSPLSTEKTPNSQSQTNKSSSNKRNDTLAPEQKTESKVPKKPEMVNQSTAASRVRTGTPSTTPSGRSEKHQSAPFSKQPQLSPRKPDNKPRVPSPLGPTKPVSSVSRKTGTGSYTRNENSPADPTRSSKIVDGITKADRPSTPGQSLKEGVTSKKRPLSDSGDEAGRPHKASKTSTSRVSSKSQPKPVSQRLENSNQTAKNGDSGLKRKANDISSHVHDHRMLPEAKHRRTESTSTHSAKYSSGSSNSGSQTTTAQTSVASPSWERSPSNVSSSSEGARLSWEKALVEAEAFQTLYYPAYIELHDRLSALPSSEVKPEDRKKLMQMHERLSQMKKEIRTASR